jgi:hypothetical protein
VRSWDNLGFRSDPPNAALVRDDAPSSADAFVFELPQPALGPGGRTLTFHARALGRRPTGILARLARGADHARAGGFGRGSLFIDGFGQGAQLIFSFTAPTSVLQGGGVTFSNATIIDEDLNVPARGPAPLRRPRSTRPRSVWSPTAAAHSARDHRRRRSRQRRHDRERQFGCPRGRVGHRLGHRRAHADPPVRQFLAVAGLTDIRGERALRPTRAA